VIICHHKLLCGPGCWLTTPPSSSRVVSSPRMRRRPVGARGVEAGGAAVPGGVGGRERRSVSDRRGAALGWRVRRCMSGFAATRCHTVVALFVLSIASIRSRWTLISPNVRLRAFASISSGNQPRTSSVHSARLNGAPPGTRPAASAGATYLRTVPRSTPTLDATTAFGRRACQCCKSLRHRSSRTISLPCSLPARRLTSQVLRGQGTEPRDAPPVVTTQPALHNMNTPRRIT
jgi:hypothetical protein